jgi:malate permease and related proteins
MAVLFEVLGIVAPVFILGLAGWVWVRTGEDFPLRFVTRLCFNIAVPCLIFVALARAEIDRGVFIDLMSATLVAYLAAGVALALLLLVLRQSQRAFLSPLTFGNTGNVGLPVALFAYGEQGLVMAVVVFAVMACLSFTVGVWLVSGGGSPREALKQPIFYGAALGLLFAMMRWRLPDWIMDSLQLAGQMAIPLMLLTLGVAIARLSAGGAGKAMMLSLARLVICGAAAWGAARWAGLEGVAADVLVLQVTMPVAVTSYLMAERYDARPIEVAGLVVASTLVSIVFIPGLLAVLLGGML